MTSVSGTQTSPVGEILPSDALSEISLDSLAEAIQRFDSAVQAGTQAGPDARRDLRRIIAANREMRVRWETADREKPAKGQRVPLGKKTNASLSDLGL